MIIQSLLDNDLYKFTMMQVVFAFFKNIVVTYKFKCRNASNWTKEMVEELREELNHYLDLKFKLKELKYMDTLGFFSKTFLSMLSKYRGDKDCYTLEYIEGRAPKLVFKGKWYLKILYEVPFLAIINEVYFRNTTNFEEIEENGKQRALTKCKKAKKSGIPFSDFGTRRRYSFAWQLFIVKQFAMLPNFGGTSNVCIAMKLGLKPIGTMAHEFIMASAGMFEYTSLRNSQKFMLEKWLEFYKDSPELLVALTDTYGSDAFIKDFDRTLAEAYTGIRHDSGCPFKWGDKFIKHYESLGIDPRTKTFVFSDGLTMDKASELYTYFKDRCKVAFGIGTHLTNDFEGVEPLQIVIKITECEGNPVAKISDTPGKGMCENKVFLDYTKYVFGIEG